eukprot:XP_027323656.1 maestro heat-like repeat family member 5 [Anas platyrhynchos]
MLLLEGRTLSLAALELAGKLPALFGDDSSTVRLLSIRLFLDTLGFVKGSQEKLQQVAHRSLLPLSLHLHDQDESVAEASREALLGVARFLRWRQLAHLAETLQSWKIVECLLARRSSAAEEYLAQSLPYLQSLQEPLRREAVRFTGLVGGTCWISTRARARTSAKMFGPTKEYLDCKIQASAPSMRIWEFGMG